MKMNEGGSHFKQSTSLNERQSLTELRMARTTAGKLGKPMHQLCSLIAPH